MVAKARSFVTFEQSADDCVSKAGISLEAGHCWNIAGEVEGAKSRLRMQDIAGIGNLGREGLGIRHKTVYSTSLGEDSRKRSDNAQG